MASYDGSELAFVPDESVYALTTADLDLTSQKLLPSVSVSVFPEAITNWLYWESGLSHK